MNIIKIDKNNQVNGDGLRCVIWLAGCNHRCQNCHNPETWDYYCGHQLTNEEYNIIINQLERDEISGVTFSGGDPLFPQNREGLTELCKDLKSKFPNKTIWCYTGYLYEQVKNLEVLNYIDVLIDGPYIPSLNPGIGKLKWRGSSNQNIIKLKKE